ncbi:MAG: hypothetical protein V3T75_02710 [candidate division Zixibacteria bacterium]
MSAALMADEAANKQTDIVRVKFFKTFHLYDIIKSSFLFAFRLIRNLL